MSQQKQRCSQTSNLIDFVIDIQGFRDDKSDFLPKEVAVLSLNGSILGHWMIEAPQDFDTLPTDIKTTNNFCTLNLHGIEWYDGEVPLSAVRAQLRKLGRQAHTIFVRGYDKVKYLESLIGRRIVNLEDYNTSVKYTELEHQFGGGLYCVIHGLQEHTEKKIFCALHRVYLLKKWLQTVLEEYNRDRPDFAQENDYHSALWHTEAKKTIRCRIAMNDLDIDNDYVLDEDEGDFDDDDDDSDNPYEIPGKPVTSPVAATSPIGKTNKDENNDKEIIGILNEATTLNKQEINSINAKILNVNTKKSPTKDQALNDDEQARSTSSPPQLSQMNKNRVDRNADGHSKVKRRLEFCCTRHKHFCESDNGRDVVDGLTAITYEYTPSSTS